MFQSYSKVNFHFGSFIEALLKHQIQTNATTLKCKVGEQFPNACCFTLRPPSLPVQLTTIGLSNTTSTTETIK